MSTHRIEIKRWRRDAWRALARDGGGRIVWRVPLEPPVESCRISESVGGQSLEPYGFAAWRWTDPTGTEHVWVDAPIADRICWAAPYAPGDVLLVGEPTRIYVGQDPDEDLWLHEDGSRVRTNPPYEPVHRCGTCGWNDVPADQLPSEAVRLRATVTEVGAPERIAKLLMRDVWAETGNSDQDWGAAVAFDLRDGGGAHTDLPLPYRQDAERWLWNWTQSHPTHPWDTAWAWPVVVNVKPEGTR